MLDMVMRADERINSDAAAGDAFGNIAPNFERLFYSRFSRGKNGHFAGPTHATA